MNVTKLPILGKTLTDVKVNKIDHFITFTCSDGNVYEMFHSQDCCESVTIESIVGEVDGLVGNPILVAEERVETGGNDDTFTWTFYTFATINGHVDIRWYGTSNGYYSERVSFEKTN
jgi:hypothetical protein